MLREKIMKQFVEAEWDLSILQEVEKVLKAQVNQIFHDIFGLCKDLDGENSKINDKKLLDLQQKWLR